MSPLEITILGVTIVAFAAVSRRIDRWPLTMPMIFVAVGAITVWIDVIEIDAEVGHIAILAEITLGVILFADAVRIDLRRLRRQLALPARLLAIALPVSIALGAVANSLLFPDLPFAQVALLAAVLAPTDAALGSAVVEEEVVPRRERLTLNVESGVNDGLVVPVVAVLTAIVIEEERSAGGWVGFLAAQIGWGVSIGVAVGVVGISTLRWARRRDFSDARYEQLATFILPVIAVFAAEALGGNSFIAAFVAGLSFGSFHLGDPSTDLDGARPSRLAEFTDDATQLLAMIAFFVFGNVLLGQVVDDITPAVLACVVLTLTLVRMLPVWLSLVGTGLRWPTRLFIGWFGPRGLASIIFGLILLEQFESVDMAAGDELFGVIGITVAASVVLHGATATWGARVYGEWAQRSRGDTERHEMDLPDLGDVLVRSRWSVRRSG